MDQDGIVNISGLDVQSKPCKTCPFAGEEPIELIDFDRYYQNVISLSSSHLCHSVDNSMICRGARDIQLKVLTCLGHLKEPTDQEFNRVSKEASGAQNP